jgi:hypothetical protein
MLAAQTWRRFVDNWAALLVAGLFAAVLTEAVRLLAVAVFPIPMIMLAVGRGMSPGTMLLWALVGGAAYAAFAPLVTGGMVHTVLQVQQGKPISMQEFWLGSLRHYGRLFRLSLIGMAVTLGLVVVGAVMWLVPFLGALVWGIASGMVAVVLAGYAPYMAVSEGLSAWAAASKAFRILNTKFVDVLLTLLVLFAATFVLGLVRHFIGPLPVVGKILLFLLNSLWWPLSVLYLAIRYQANIAPSLTPPGGSGMLRSKRPPTGA